MTKRQRRQSALDATDPSTEPPEELRALCSLADIRIDYVNGRAARTWRLSRKELMLPVPSITIQTVEYEVWRDAVKQLVDDRERDPV